MKKWIFSNLSFLLIASSLSANSALWDQEVIELKSNVTAKLGTLHGWCSAEKASHFMDLVLEVKPKVCVEIGVFGGSSVFPVASALKFLGEGVIICIDPWDKIECIKYYDPKEDEAHLNWWGKINLDQIYNSFLAMIKIHGLENQCVTIKSTSEKAAPTVKSDIDILYIDGSHSEEVSTMDVELYLPKVRSGGYIWINDSLSTEMQEAVELLMEQCEVVKLIDNGNCILFKKR